MSNDMSAKKMLYIEKPQNGQSLKRRKWFHKLLLLFIVIVVLFILVSMTLAIALPKLIETPDLETLIKEKPLQVTRVYSDKGEIIGEFAKENRIPVPIKKMPKNLKNAIVAVEDENFYRHGGIDPMGIARAILRNIETGRKAQGASTIPQQLARILYLSREKSYSRKLKEMVIAIKISQKYTKDQVLELYLNRIYLGHGMYGVEAASNFYFGKPVDKLSLSECALLAGLPQRPEIYSPFRSMAKAKSRRSQVLDRMVDEGYITKKQATNAKLTPIYVSKRRERFTASNYFVEQVRRQIVEDPNYGYAALYQEGLRIYTTMNSPQQRAAQDVLRNHLEQFEINQQARINSIGKTKKGEVKAETMAYAKIVKVVSSTELSVTVNGQPTKLYLPEEVPYLKKENILKPDNYLQVKVLGVNSRKQPVIKFVGGQHIQGALIAVDPSNGQIKAMMGGYDFTESEYNRAMQAYRQPGSAFKPIVYAAALDNAGISPSDKILDEPVSFGNYTPQNYDHKFRGLVSVRYALEQSLNIPALKLASKVGIDQVIEYANKLGIRDTDTRKLNHDLTLALGSLNVTPLEMANAFAVFANGGTWHQNEIIRYINDHRGVKIDEFPVYSQEALDPQVCYVLTDMLKGVIRKGTAARTVGSQFKYPAAGKTGTTNDYSDAWFVGYTPDISVCVWVGYDQRKSLGSGMTGGSVAGPIWRDFMNRVCNESNSRDFAKPDGVVYADICSVSGKLATSRCFAAAEEYLKDPANAPRVKILHESFKTGSEPKESCTSDHTVTEPDTEEITGDSESNIPGDQE